MARQGGSFGVVILIVVVAVVLLLVAQAWKNLGPTAVQVSGAAGSGPLDAHGENEAGEAVRSGQLPDLEQTRKSTAEHAQQTQEALKAIE